jgi:hypothetical protein
MANIFNDLNKLVNTAQKIDKLLTEKPKRTRIKPKSKSDKIYELLDELRDYITDYKDLMKEEDYEDIITIINLLHKLNN